eukprot:TRINITY_DN11414_c0_g1_i1.p1 TRINITY_DN11414_c0_g1~~TRINITY_DN11414_c0_g1_i1.p1  ORF type:complete len:119 (+),score=26.18 TRINITY_DN11414_c0_g1_i1:23-358(+)
MLRRTSIRCFSNTTVNLFSWPRTYHEKENGNQALKLVKYGKGAPSEKKTVVWMKMCSAAGHPWYHITARRSVKADPDKRTEIQYDPVIQRSVLFHEKKSTGLTGGKKKWAQ